MDTGGGVTWAGALFVTVSAVEAVVVVDVKDGGMGVKRKRWT